MMGKTILALSLALTIFVTSTANAQLLIKPGERIAVIGDSITYHKMYTRAIECYLLVSGPQTDFRFMQAGISGDRAAGFSGRMDTDLILYFKPTLVLNLYGSNDASYQPYSEEIGDRYRTALDKIYARMKQDNILLVEGGPDLIDPIHYKARTPAETQKINDSLGRLSAIAGERAKAHGYRFTGHNARVVDITKRAKAEYGQEYAVVGVDGLHPQSNGHLVIAYGFLKTLGLDGNIGTITVDLNGKAVATDGHKVIESDKGQVTLQSTRYPFCFFDKTNDPFSKFVRSGNRDILPFLPFNEDLNRYMLVVKNLNADKAQVTWGSETKVFTREQLTQGINLAAEFFDNPFLEPFLALDKLVGEKQEMETSFVYQIRSLEDVAKNMEDDKKFRQLVDEMRAQMLQEQEQLSKEVRESVKPVRHTITVKPL